MHRLLPLMIPHFSFETTSRRDGSKYYFVTSVSSLLHGYWNHQRRKKFYQRPPRPVSSFHTAKWSLASLESFVNISGHCHHLQFELRESALPILFALLLFIAKLGLQTPAKRSSHSSSSSLSNSTPICGRLPSLASGDREFEMSPPSSFSQLEDERVLLVSSMNLPTLYLCVSSSAASYFQPMTSPQKAQLTSLTVCCPVTSCRFTGWPVCVLRRCVAPLVLEAREPLTR